MTALAPHLLPDGYSAWEEELARLSASLDAIDPSVIETIWDAWRCPAPLLPWLAWALSVDVWDDVWPETIKRKAISDSPEYHRRKGTRRAVEMMLDLAGRPYTLTEWFERTPPGRRGTTSVHIEADLDQAAAILQRVKPLVYAAKPKSRAIALGVGDLVSGFYDVGGACLIETVVAVEPFAFAASRPEGAFVVSFGALCETLTTIEAA